MGYCFDTMKSQEIRGSYTTFLKTNIGFKRKATGQYS